MTYWEAVAAFLAVLIISACGQDAIDWPESDGGTCGMECQSWYPSPGGSEGNGEYEKINEALMPAEGSPTQGATYEFVDDEVKNRHRYSYKLEDVDLNGVSTMHGPVSASPRFIYATAAFRQAGRRGG